MCWLPDLLRPELRAHAKPLETRAHSCSCSPVSTFFHLTIPWGTPMPIASGFREPPNRPERKTERKQLRETHPNWLSQCFFTLGWARSQLSSSRSRALGPPAPSSEPTDTGWAWLSGGISGPPAVMSAWEPEVAAGSLTSSVITSFTQSRKNPTQSRQTCDK